MFMEISPLPRDNNQGTNRVSVDQHGDGTSVQIKNKEFVHNDIPISVNDSLVRRINGALDVVVDLTLFDKPRRIEERVTSQYRSNVST